VPAPPFEGPGIDLRGDEARAILAEAKPILAWLEAREPGIVLRSLSMDLVRLRVLVTLEQEGDRPRVLRFDPPSANELVDAAGPLIVKLGVAAAKVLERRALPRS
jgi:hypothetical protein